MYFSTKYNAGIALSVELLYNTVRFITIHKAFEKLDFSHEIAIQEIVFAALYVIWNELFIYFPGGQCRILPVTGAV